MISSPSRGGPAREITVTLRIAGDDLDPRDVTRALGRSPTESYRKGEPYTPVPGKTSQHTTGGWRLEGARRGPDCETAIRGLLARVSPDPAVWQQLAAKFHVDLFVGVFLTAFNEDLSLSAALLAVLDARGLALHFDIYNHSFLLSDLEALLEADGMPDAAALRAAAEDEMKETGDDRSDAGIAVASVLLEDANLFRRVLQRRIARDGAARGGAASRLATAARRVLAQAPAARAWELSRRLSAYARSG